MPRKRKRERQLTHPEDRFLRGTWWRCPTHGLNEDPIHLGGKTYCPADACTEVAVLVHSTLQDRAENRRGWNDVVVSK